MKTTHVGSLPYLKVEDALDYTFKFDIPCLFTLPKLDNNQFMDKEIFSLRKRKKPFFFDEFVNEAKRRKITKIKYQLMGPITFMQIGHHENMIIGEYQDLVVKMIKTLSSHFEVIFSLDEPYLSHMSETKFNLLNEFKNEIDIETQSNTYIHCCAKLSDMQLSLLKDIPLNLDLSLYSLEDLGRLKSVYPGVSLDSEMTQQRDRFVRKSSLVTPSCGLALNNVKELSSVFSYLRSFQNKSF